jgi:hypothetical protein
MGGFPRFALLKTLPSLVRGTELVREWKAAVHHLSKGNPFFGELLECLADIIGSPR